MLEAKIFRRFWSRPLDLFGCRRCSALHLFLLPWNGLKAEDVLETSLTDGGHKNMVCEVYFGEGFLKC